MSKQPAIAVLSDIHANLEALRAVLDDIAQRDIRHVYCLGDTVGYGPDPEACVSLVRDFDVVLRGNFDDQVVSDNRDALPQTREEGQRTRDRLSSDSIDFLSTRPTRHVVGSSTYAHGSPLDNGYLFPEDVYNARKMAKIFDAFEGVFFCGHSHLAGVYTIHDYLSPELIDDEFKINAKDIIINVGSVGQPRDGDNRTCYVILERDIIRFIRLDYDMDTTIRKLRDGGWGPTNWDM